ncbi:hypothetical protein A3A60_00485 [Candidatus Curtissbacteria bacterium RIFCSPLOWO2_01_FULL_42_26]|uniref:Bifunctional protein FolD n=1 Tax=Candidatus Curtissbacteria bacterium RIFCSPLOWO2_01_FULL_42_26 TaxID=1797729 RepID=A0A1F5I1C0_9BACT|nr:MAG: hypothetical protein A3A60_00485 [Candidatus Curtissbacteria bacterium RIFCSPLOWO2_01_FULL_42_26]
MAKILDGRIVRDKIAEKLKTLNSKLETKPKLVIIQIGDLAESNAYIRQKILFGEKIGAEVIHQKFPDNVDHVTLAEYIYTLNSDPTTHGIIIQLPIAQHLNKDGLIDTINPEKDVDGQTATNIKLVFEGSSTGFIPATTKGILTLLNYYKIDVAGKKAVVVGRSSLVGKPTALALLNLGATVTICHSQTRNLAQETRNADILVIAVGKPGLITKDHVKKGQVVIDVGINVLDNSQSAIGNSQKKLVGDVNFDEVAKIVAEITPVPGGVGPLTVASLFENLLEACTRQT